MTSISIIKKESEFRSLRTLWNRLLCQSINRNIFLSYEWLDGWLKYHNEYDSLCIFVVKDSRDDECIGIAPFMVSKSGIIRFIGEGISDYAGIIVAEGREYDVYDKIFSYLENNTSIWTGIELKEIGERDSLVSFIDHYKVQSKLKIDIGTCSYCTQIELSRTWLEYYDWLRSDLRKEIKCAYMKLSRSNSSSIFANISCVESCLLQQIFSIHKRRLMEKGKRGYPESFYKFLNYILDTNSLLGNTLVSIITINGEVAAYGISYILGNTLYLWNMGMDSRFKKFSPGKLLLYRLIQSMYESADLALIDLLRGEEPYKRLWANSNSRNLSIQFSMI